MPRQKLIAARVSDDLKEAFTALARSREETESAMLIAMIETLVRDNPHACSVPEPQAKSSERMTLRLRPGDRALIDARAAMRNMKPSSYCVMLLRAHVRGTSPLPTDELNTLKVTLGEISAIGRNLNQITRANNCGSKEAASTALDVIERTREIVDRARRDVAGLILANNRSWETNDA